MNSLYIVPGLTDRVYGLGVAGLQTDVNYSAGCDGHSLLSPVCRCIKKRV